MRVLILKRAALGDAVRATSLLAPLAARHPGARVTWAAGDLSAPLLEGLGAEVLVPARAEALPDRSFDLVLSLEEDLACARLAARVSAGELVGVIESDGALTYTPSSAPYYGMSLLRSAADGGKAEADRLKAANRDSWARLWCRVLGLDPGPCPRPRFAPTAEEASRARAGGGRPVLGFSPWAALNWPAKSLSVEAARAAAAAMAAEGWAVVLLAGPERAGDRARAAEGVPRGAADGGDAPSLRDYAARVFACDAVVSADTLALHLAAAAGLPLAAFVGPTSAAELDLGPRGRLLLPEGGCSCFYRARCARAVSCLDALPPASFAAAARRLREEAAA